MWEGWKIKEYCEKERKQETDLEKEGGGGTKMAAIMKD